ncbi:MULTISPECIES: 2,3-diaminopropionate biosynthesis protein SbnA [unclassified Streptomyces]|uniref:2,3-diaminopropionate biosynthesis protein SbnA n=1 Tax=unclassified Streptomyces TaxID=2593676 RepID=UPI00379C7232
MPVVTGAHELLDTDVYVDLTELLGANLRIKCEGFNFGGSVKIRVAARMVDEAERAGLIRPDTVLVESSSGNLGVSLAIVAAARGVRFHCVTDAKCNPAAVRLMRALGAGVEVVEEGSAGRLAMRKARVRGLCAADPRYLWLNQYENSASWLAHYDLTGPAIAKEFADIDVLFVGVGTGGTLTGCARYFRDHLPAVRIIAVDAYGSVNFGGSPAPRHIPGLGAGEPMPLVDAALVDQVVRVTESDTVRMCRRLAAHGLLLGGSSGTVISAAVEWLEKEDPDGGLTAVAIAPDLGERYLDTIYDDAWVARHFTGLADGPRTKELLV